MGNTFCVVVEIASVIDAAIMASGTRMSSWAKPAELSIWFRNDIEAKVEALSTCIT
jgi:hypothetical protein